MEKAVDTLGRLAKGVGTAETKRVLITGKAIPQAIFGAALELPNAAATEKMATTVATLS